jgi:RHS repeat-associated protein
MATLVDAINQRYRFNYDALGQLRHMRRGADVMTFSYDPVGNRKTRTDYNGALTDYTYDALNRLKTITYPDTTTVSYTYDRLSRLQTATNENGTVNFDYNKMNRVTTVTDVFGQVVDYNYDANGNRTKLSLNSVIVATYRYDAVDRVTKILDAASLATNYTYDVTSKLTSRRLPNGILTTYQYDGLDRLTRLLDTKGVTTVADHQYQYNTASQITQVAEPTITKSYGYDTVDRLTSALYSNPVQANENYVYDGVGNRTASQLSASYTYQRFNRLTSTAAATYSYDANGNLTSKTDSNGTTQYSWDFENRLKQVTLPNGSTVSYKYDGLGRRIQRTPSSGVSTNFVYDGQDVLKDLNSDGSTVDYLNGLGIDNRLRLTDSRITALGPLYFLQDHLSSTTSLTNSLGVAVSQISYDAFGNAGTSANLTRYTYTGREFDSDTGLFYYRTRWYDPQVGRFASEDPIGFRGGANFYTYVDNNSVNSNDPLGLFTVKDGITQQRAVDIDTQCGSRTAGACTRRVAARVVCSCKCDGTDWKASAELRIYGEMWITSGPFPYKGRKPKDKSAVDAASARAHEYNFHINPSIAAVTPLINELEAKTFKSQQECRTECDKTSDRVGDRFRRKLLETQARENWR